MTDVKTVHRRYDAYAGFVTTPRYFDDSPQQFLQVAPKGTGILQRVNHIPGYDYELGQRAKNFYVLEESAICLGRSFCQAIGQVGTNWAHCNAVGIPFISEALSWEPGARDEVSWYDGGSWHENLRSSDGLKPQPRKYIDVSEAPDRVKEIYDIVLPHYEHLHAHRLKAPEMVNAK